MIQFLADNIDQLDLALDQLAVGERNFDRFAFMLIDNVVELTLHNYVYGEALSNRASVRTYTRLAEIEQLLAEKKGEETKTAKKLSRLIAEQKIIGSGLSQAFDNKVKAASKLGLIDSVRCESILYLHSYRNSAYHKGLRHESILHSLAIFYFRNACALLKAYQPNVWIWGHSDKLSHRAIKYLGDVNVLDLQTIFYSAYSRLDYIAASMAENLVGDLAADFSATINSIDKTICFLAREGHKKMSRDEVTIYAQSWAFAHTTEAEKFARANGCREKTSIEFIEWLNWNYNWPFKSDPIPAWRKRQKELEKEKDYHKALKRYCDFMRQTEALRAQLDESAAALDMHIQQEIDRMRGK